MHIFRTKICVMVVLLGLVVDSNAGIFFALKAIKQGLPLLAATGLLGTLKLALMSKASVVLGTIGTVLGATALARDKKSRTVIIYQNKPKGHGHSSGYGEDWGRTDETDQTEDFEDRELREEDFEYIRKDDPAFCTEKLVCEIGAKSSYYPSQLRDDEIDILNLIKTKPQRFGGVGSRTHQSLFHAMQEGFNGVNCAKEYDSCSFDSNQMMSLVRMFSKNILQNPWDYIKKFIRS